MVRCSVLAFVALSSLALPTLAGPLGTGPRGPSARTSIGMLPRSEEAIAISSDKRGPPGAFIDRLGDLAYYEPESGYPSGYKYDYANQYPDGRKGAHHLGDSDATAETVASSKSTVAARSASQHPTSRAGTSLNTTAAVVIPKFVTICMITKLSQQCIAAGNAICSPAGNLNAKDPRCARACNCVRM